VIIPPFEEDFDLHLNKLEFPSNKKYLIPCSLIEMFHFKRCFPVYTNVKIVSPLLSPTLTLGDHNLYKLKSAPSQKAFIQI
jgi:hypothetical protein